MAIPLSCFAVLCAELALLWFSLSLIFFSAKVLIAAGVSVAIGQLSKPFTSVFLYGKGFDIRAVVQAGGFPSSHSSVWPFETF